MIGLLPAAGRGVRAYPYTATVPKSMLEVDGVPNLERNVLLLRDQLGCRTIRIVIGHHGDVIRRHFGDGSRLGVSITYIENDRLDWELPYSVYLGTRDLDRPCCMLLADECYIHSNHRDLLRLVDAPALAVCGLIRGEYAKQVRKNYVVTLRDGGIVDMEEKPRIVRDRLMGAGTYLLQPEAMRRLADAFAAGDAARPRDWTTWLAELARGGGRLLPFHLTGRYVNINSRDDLNYANYLVRDADFSHRTTSLVYVVDGEDEAALRPLPEYAAVPEVDEVVAVARRPTPALERAAALPKVRVFTPADERATVGDLVRLGLDRASGDILICSYSDDTFAARDVAKFREYLRDADMVMGTRTTRQLIEQGTNMRGVVRASHVALAKLMELVWWRFEYRFSDVCCVYRALWRSTYSAIRPQLVASDAAIFPEMVLEVLRARRRIVEIPINYYNRDMHSDYVRSEYQSVGTFLRVIGLILRKPGEDLGWLGAARAGATSAADAPQ